VHPGDGRFPLADGITAAGLAEMQEVLSGRDLKT